MSIESIASASISMSMAKVQTQASLSITKKAMDAQEQQAAQLIEQLEAAIPPSNHIIDVLA